MRNTIAAYLYMHMYIEMCAKFMLTNKSLGHASPINKRPFTNYIMHVATSVIMWFHLFDFSLRL